MKVSPNVFYSVMEKIEGAELRKAEKAQACCGFAGLWSIKNPRLSESVQREKIEDFGNTGADYILTSCPGCVLQLRDGIKKFSSTQRVLHLADYLAGCYTDIKD
jgi:glycolate oxidase iron-sulfur subunit